MPCSTLFPYTTLFRSSLQHLRRRATDAPRARRHHRSGSGSKTAQAHPGLAHRPRRKIRRAPLTVAAHEQREAEISCSVDTEMAQRERRNKERGGSSEGTAKFIMNFLEGDRARGSRQGT